MDPTLPKPAAAEKLTSSAEAAAAVSSDPASKNISSRIGHFRWVICALLLFGTTKNYMDRNVLGVLNKTLQHDLGWSEIDYSNLVVAFQAAYAVGMVVVGRLIDKLGTRLGYALAMIFWSLASMSSRRGSSQSNQSKGSKRRYECATCRKTFTTSGHVARHNRIHTGEKNFQCPEPGCSQRFSRQDNCM